MKTKMVRTRFAPSPTGFLHVGGLRTALFNFLFARHNQGEFILRIEDTDRSREVDGAAEDIVSTLRLFGLDFDEGPTKQSDRLSIYKKHAEKLVEKGIAYKCYCSEERLKQIKDEAMEAGRAFRYDKHCLKNPNPSINSRTKYVIRQNIPEEGTTEFEDEVYGKISIENRLVDDSVLIKSDGWPVYNFANVIDDHDMGVTHVIRGEEFISSTPKHILLYQAFGWDIPKFVHLPLILDKNRKKLSKRTGDVAVHKYLEQGYLPEALLNFIAFLGWNPKNERELFTLNELIAEFTLEKINKAAAVFDLDKLLWFNSQYLKQKSDDEVLELSMPYFEIPASEKVEKEFLKAITEIERARLKAPSEIGERAKYFFLDPEYDHNLLHWKKATNEEIRASLGKARNLISNIQLTASKSEVEKIFLNEIGEGDKGTILWPLRVALTGLKASPGPFEIIYAFLKHPKGKEIMLKRIDVAIAKLSDS